MEMRRFIIELHPDGEMTWCEIAESNEYKKLADMLNVEKTYLQLDSNNADNVIDRVYYNGELNAVCKILKYINEQSKRR